jgi:hypothetical protein
VLGGPIGRRRGGLATAVRRPGPRTILVVVIVLGAAAWIAGFAVAPRHSARTDHDARLVGAEDLLGMWRSSRLLAPDPAMEFQFRTLRAARKASRLVLAAALDLALTVPS